MLALASTILVVASVLPMISIGSEALATAVVVGIAVAWVLSVVMMARATRLLVTGAPEHRHSATRLALGVLVPALGGLGAGCAGVSLVAFFSDDAALVGRWAGVGAVLTLIVLALAMWACAEIASASPRHARTGLVSATTNLGVICVMIGLAVVVLAVMGVLNGSWVVWASAILMAVVGVMTTLAALSARAIVGALILARETAEIGPEIEPVSGP